MSKQLERQLSIYTGFVSELCRRNKNKKGFKLMKPFTVNALPSGLEPETL